MAAMSEAIATNRRGGFCADARGERLREEVDVAVGDLPEIVAGFAFGALFDDRAHARGDLDLAIFFAKNVSGVPRPGSALEVSARARRRLGRKVDAMALEGASPGAAAS